MVKKESVTINVPTGMAKYLVTLNPEAELTRNALLLYPYMTMDELDDELDTFRRMKEKEVSV